MIPTTLPAVAAAISVACEGLPGAEAVAHPSIVIRVDRAFDLLRAIPEPTDAQLIALVGCARVIASNGWNNAALAADLLIERAATIAALPQPEMPVLPAPPVPEAMDDLTP